MNTPKQSTELRQASLVAAALALAAVRSPAEVTTAALAQAVGITQGAVFRHFESKEAIWLAVIDFAHQDLLARLPAAGAGRAAAGDGHRPAGGGGAVHRIGAGAGDAVAAERPGGRDALTGTGRF